MILQHAELAKAAYKGKKVCDHSYLAESFGGAIVIAIAGTANIENLIEDASVWPSLTPTKALAHAGVVRAYRELRPAILPHIRKDTEITFVGHSLGGGTVQIFAEEFGAEVITFGALKTYFRFWPAPNLKHTRIVRDDDPIPLIPGVMYSHRVDPVILEDRDGRILPQLEDHPMDAYIRLLKKETRA